MIHESWVKWFANNFHSWLRHSWKLLANRFTRDPKIVIHDNSCIILYILLCWDFFTLIECSAVITLSISPKSSQQIVIYVLPQSLQYYIPCYMDGLVQERCNSIAKAPELRLSCTNPSISHHVIKTLKGHDWSTFSGQSGFWNYRSLVYMIYICDLVQDYSISIANTLEILQSCTKPSICFFI